MSNQDVLDMVKAKLSTELIVTTVENAKSPFFDVQTATIISLKRSGVDDRIVQAMVKAMSAGRSSGAVTPSPSSYVDGYQMGWMYGNQVRRSGEPYNPNDIVLPGALIADMTVKLGAIEYEKWEDGYFKGHEDGRMGRPRSPTSTAGSAAKPPEEKREPSSRTRAAIKSAQTRYRGAAIFAVFHDHGGVSTKECEGFLVATKGKLILQGTEAASDGQIHNFDVAYDLVQEVKTNRFTIFFHVKLKDKRNFNLWTPDETAADVVAKILSIAPTQRK
jgi:hypothetical protein